MKFLEIKNNQNVICQSLWYITKTVLRDKCIALNAYIKKEEMQKFS